ncbi:MAG: DUF2977 domain-containing protein [Ruminococcaceae bacterium]|nr:DUF2977 domain-containing protein [Oscillospiraceae bacterium]
MQIRINENGYVQSYAEIGNLTNGIEIEAPSDLEHFEVNFEAYQVKDGVLIFDEDKRLQLDNQHILDDLRFEREQQCFPIINRGQLWYEMLSETQVAELQLWYQAWLDVTETLLIPERPGWLT